MKKSHILAICTAGLLGLGAMSSAQAQSISFGFSNNGNYVGISSGPTYYPFYPTYVAPAPVYYPNTYYAPPPVYYAPPRYYRPYPPPRYYGPRYGHGYGYGHHGRW